MGGHGCTQDFVTGINLTSVPTDLIVKYIDLLSTLAVPCAILYRIAGNFRQLKFAINPEFLYGHKDYNFEHAHQLAKIKILHDATQFLAYLPIAARTLVLRWW